VNNFEETCLNLATLIADETGAALEQIMYLRHSNKEVPKLLRFGVSIEELSSIHEIGSIYDYVTDKRPRSRSLPSMKKQNISTMEMDSILQLSTMSIRPIPLTDHDLRQMSDERVSSLTPSQKAVLLVRALAELRKSRDRLNQTPSNSSKPPSSRAPWESASSDDAVLPTITAPTVFDVDAAKPSATVGATTPTPSAKAPSGKSSTKNAGKQVGAKGFGRTQKLAYTETTPHHPDSCAGCGQALSYDGAVAYTAWDDIDIAEKLASQVGLFLQVTPATTPRSRWHVQTPRYRACPSS
jgi:hypothetical protein